jgi:hypothetical protein
LQGNYDLSKVRPFGGKKIIRLSEDEIEIVTYESNYADRKHGYAEKIEETRK